MSEIEIPKPLEEPAQAHSPLGASSAERWMNCPGSVTLIQQLQALNGDDEEEEPDYRRDGTQAHALAAHCLEREIDAWEANAEGKFPDLQVDMMSAVQDYLDFVREQPGRRFVEQRVHLPEFHKQFYGTLDCVVTDRRALHVIDYKHGIGVVVDATDNLQLKYYAYGFIQRNCAKAKDNWPVKLTIVQPRAWHPDGEIRTWTTTVGAIRRWAEEELRPAMEATADLDYLALGPWCRFCPAKLICPAYEGLANKALQGSTQITYAEAQQLKMLIKAVEDQAFKALMGGAKPENVGAKLVSKKANRVWKDNAETELRAKFGDDAFVTAPLSPAQVEKLPFGKPFVSEYAYTPDNGVTLAALDDKRTERPVKTAAQTFAAWAGKTS